MNFLKELQNFMDVHRQHPATALYYCIFGDYYLTGEYSAHCSTDVIVAHGYIDMRSKLHRLLQVCRKVTVI